MHKKGGFTLIELLVTLVVVAIVVSIALPAFNAQLQNNRSLAIGENFVTALNFARSEAVKRGQAVVLCPSNNTQNGCGTDWSNGWVVALDNAIDTSPMVNTATPILRYWNPAPDNAVFSVQTMEPDLSSPQAATFIRYTGMGMLARIGGNPGVTRIDAYASGCSGNSMRRITVGVTGSTGIERIACPA